MHREWLVEFYFVDFFHLILRMRKCLCEISVVCKQQYTGSITVEPADRIYSFCCGAPNQVKHGFTALRVFGGGKKIFWFVEQDINRFAGRCNFFTADFYQVCFFHFMPWLDHLFTVDGYFPFFYEVSSVAS